MVELSLLDMAIIAYLLNSQAACVDGTYSNIPDYSDHYKIFINGIYKFISALFNMLDLSYLLL